jgi:hypothetical protein
MGVDGRKWIAGLPESMDDQRQILLNLLDWCESEPRIAFFAVACSVGRGAGDSLSDLDTGMAIDVAEADFEAEVADVRRAVDQAAGLVESYHHKLPGVTFTHERIFAQYENRCQVDLVVIPASVDYGGVKDEVILYDPDGRRTAKFEPRPVTPKQVREWAFNAWACLADVGKYLRRRSYWEALERLHQARNDYWRLLATALDVPNPQYGITSLLDYAPDRVPPEMSDTVATAAQPRRRSELERVLPISPRDWQDRTRAILLRRVDDRPVLLPAAGQGRRGGWVRHDGRA